MEIEYANKAFKNKLAKDYENQIQEKRSRMQRLDKKEENNMCSFIDINRQRYLQVNI